MPARIELFGVQIDSLRMDQAIGQILAWVADSSERCQFVVTPNVDHIVMLQHDAALQAAYEDAGMVLADGTPVLWSAQLLSRPLPQRVAGSDLVPSLFAAIPNDQPLTIFLLGAAPGVADRAAANIRRRWPAVQVVGMYSPPLGFERDEQQTAEILRRIDATRPDVLVVGLGAPKQELWVHRHRDKLKAKVALCVGATIDFLAGERKRAPVWMRHVGLEWVYRVLGEPKRLASRYARDAIIFPRLVAQEWWRLHRPAQARG